MRRILLRAAVMIFLVTNVIGCSSTKKINDRILDAEFEQAITTADHDNKIAELNSQIIDLNRRVDVLFKAASTMNDQLLLILPLVGDVTK